MNESFTENQIYIKRIVDSSLNGDLVYFIGSGFSKIVNDNNKNWKELIEILKKKLDTKEKDYLKVAQMYFDNYNDIELKKEIKNNLFSDIKNKDILDKLFNTKPSIICTTNWDEIFENYIRSERENFLVWNTVVKDRDIIELKQSNKLLIKLHGDLKNNNFVFTEDSYFKYDKNFKLIRNLIINILATKTVVFFGYGFSDPDIKQIINFFNEEEVKQLSLYYVNTSPDKDEDEAKDKDEDKGRINSFEKKYLEKYGLKVIDYDSDRVNKYFKDFDEMKSSRTIVEKIDKENKYYSNERYIYINHLFDLFSDERKKSRFTFEVLFDKGLILYLMYFDTNEESCILYNEMKKQSKEEKDYFVLKKESVFYKYFSKMKINYICFEIKHIQHIIEIDKYNDNFFELVSFEDKRKKFNKFIDLNMNLSFESKHTILSVKKVYNKIKKFKIKENRNDSNSIKYTDLELKNMSNLMSYIDQEHIFRIEKLLQFNDIYDLYMKISEKTITNSRKNKNNILYNKFDDIHIFSAKLYSIVMFVNSYYYPIEYYVEFGNLIKLYISFFVQHSKGKIKFDKFIIYVIVSYLRYKDIKALISDKKIELIENETLWIENIIKDLLYRVKTEVSYNNVISLNNYSDYLLNIICIITYVNNKGLFNKSFIIFKKLLSECLLKIDYIEAINSYIKYQEEYYKRHYEPEEIFELIDLLIFKIIGDERVLTNYAEVHEIQRNRLNYVFVIALNNRYEYNNIDLTKKLIEYINNSLKLKDTDFYDIYSLYSYFLKSIYYVSSDNVRTEIKKFYQKLIDYVKKRNKYEYHDIDTYIMLSAEFKNEIIDFNEVYIRLEDILDNSKGISSILYNIRQSLIFYKEKRKIDLPEDVLKLIEKCIKLIDKYIEKLSDIGIRFR